MKIVIAGGTGFIGRNVMEHFAASSHSVVLLSRNPAAVKVPQWPNVHVVKWDGRTAGAWYSEIEGADAIVNLAGESIGGKRWTSNQKQKILESRINATRALIESVNRAKKKPPVLINGSAVGYYGPVESDDVTESHARGNGFLADVCEAWERVALSAQQYGTRVVLLRTAVVIGGGSVALEKLSLPFKLYVGGPIGSGRQWFPWIHVNDVMRAIQFAIESESISGPLNLAAPEPSTMKQFCRALGKAMQRPSWAPVPGFILKIALGEMSSMILTGQKVVPSKLLQHGYSFIFPKLDGALGDIFS
ncbi:MAG: TIGR01777 family oxidoreductase [Bacteroidetes bacterium]|nr:TIGR01777 family oxidoreductase [Bacteroidota bacterium]MCW5894452.1 TIGR01777 family oxidoreductase [Bacteroidota bacterium]